MKLRRYTLLSCLLCFLCSAVNAQNFRALLSGVIRDPSGSAIVGATVTVRNVDTGLVGTVQAGSDGAYFIPQLPIGNYQLTVDAAGFKKYTRDGITLALGDKAIADVQMEIGNATESVSVTEELTGIESGQSVLGQTLTSNQMIDTAIGGRNFINFMQFSAGVLGHDSITQNATNAGENNNGRDMNFKFQGGWPNSMLFLIDGASNGLQGGASFVPLMDAIQEMKVSAPISDASFGLSGGGVISVNTKSGTNQLHGVLNEYFQNNVLDAWSTQQKVAIQQNPALKYRKKRDNVYSGMLSGPVIKDKLFFAGYYEGRRTASATPTNVSVPTLQQRSGDFSQTFNSAGQLDVIYDPLTTRQVGDRFIRDAFPGNIIPADRMNAVSRNILALVPSPNFSSANSPITNVNNYYVGNNPSSVSYQAFFGKGDYVWNESHRTSAVWKRSARTGYSATDNGFLRPNPLVAVNGDPIKRQHQGAILDHVAIFNPTTILTVRAAWDFWVEKVFGTTQWGYDGTQLGFTGPTGMDGIAIPKFAFSGGPVAYANFGNSQNDLRPKTNYELSGDLSKTIGRHFLRFGARAAQIRESYSLRGNYLGALTVDAGFTQANPLQADATSGNPMASFLLGYPSGGAASNNQLLTFYMNQISMYVQDDFRVSSKLMLNFGLRWDVQMPQRERFDRMNIGFDPTSTYALGGSSAAGSVIFAGPQDNRPFSTQYTNFSPRFGVAYQITKKLTYRGGAGISYLPMDAYRSGTSIEDPGLTAGYAVDTPYVAATGGGADLYTPYRPGTSTLANPFPNGFLQPLGSALGSSAFVGTGITVRDRNYKVPYVFIFQSGFQYELPFKATLEVSYVGSRTRRIPISKNINYIPLDQRLLGVANPSYLTASVPNPFFGAPQLARTPLAAATITRNQSLLPFPQFTGVTQNATSMGSSWYNALELRMNKRLSHGASVVLTYTFSKAMEATTFREPQYASPNRELSSWDRTQNLNIAMNYQIPIGRGRQFLSGAKPAVNTIIGGWQINASVVYLNGMPLMMPDATPVRDPRLPEGQQTPRQYFNTCTQLTNGTRSHCSGDEPITWRQLAPNELRTYAIYSPNIRTPTIPRTNISLFKTFSIYDRLNLEFRASAYNALNGKNPPNPDVNVTSATFGQALPLGNQANGPRVGEFALRLLW